MAESSTGSVVSIRGQPYACPAQPDLNLVEYLERLAEKARSGELVGIAGGCLYGDRSSGSFMHGATTMALLGAATMAVKRLTDSLDN